MDVLNIEVLLKKHEWVKISETLNIQKWVLYDRWLLVIDNGYFYVDDVNVRSYTYPTHEIRIIKSYIEYFSKYKGVIIQKRNFRLNMLIQ